MSQLSEDVKVLQQPVIGPIEAFTLSLDRHLNGRTIGIRAAAGALRGPMRPPVLTDSGSQVALAAIKRIRICAGSPASFATVTKLEQYFRSVYKP